MNVSELLTADRITCKGQASSKKRALEQVSQLLASAVPGLSGEAVFDSLVGRERLGSTGLGSGVAIPHGRTPDTDTAIAAFVHLDEGIDFDAIDGAPVDILFALLVPDHYTDEHLEILASLAEAFSNPEFSDHLRHCETAQQVLDSFNNHSEARAG